MGEEEVLVTVRSAQEGRDPEGVADTLIYAIRLRSRQVVWDWQRVLETSVGLILYIWGERKDILSLHK
jgi:hypothetical protein